MQTIVVQGEYTTLSYERIKVFIKEAKKRSWDVVRIDKDDDVANFLMSSRLFEKQRLIVLEDYKNIDKNTLKFIGDHKDNEEITLVIYQKGLVPKSVLEKLPNLKKIETYNPPKLIFKFLESVYPKNAKNCLRFLQEAVRYDPVELIFHLLATHLRDLYWVKCDPSTIPYASWRVSRLETQAGKFEEESLKRLISALAKVDIEVKSSDKDLLVALDLLLASHLK
jgi:DNA polymerase III delta subunit